MLPRRISATWTNFSEPCVAQTTNWGAVDILAGQRCGRLAARCQRHGRTSRVAAAIGGTNVVAVAALSFALLPAMLERRWGRIVNVSSAIAEHPGAMIGANAYATGKAALEAHTLNLAAELAGSGVTVNAFRPGSVDTAMQAWIRGQDPARIGAPLHERFARSYAEGLLISPKSLPGLCSCTCSATRLERSGMCLIHA